MQRNFWGIIVAALLFVGCGDDAASGAWEYYENANSLSSLGSCDDEHENDSVYVVKENVYMACQDGFWLEFDGDAVEHKSGSDSEKSKKGSSSSSKKSGDSDDGDEPDDPDDDDGDNNNSYDSDDENSSGSGAKKSSSSSVQLPNHYEGMYVAADDTLFSVKYLNECNSSHEGKFVFVISLEGYLRCEDEKWVEYEPPAKLSSSSGKKIDSGNQSGKSDLSNYFDVYEDTTQRSSSSFREEPTLAIYKADSVFGKCESKLEGKIFVDSLGAIYGVREGLFFCKNGVWTGVSADFANKLEFGDAPDGTFAKPHYGYTVGGKMSKYCRNEIKGGTLYVMDGNWRSASEEEACFETMCSFANQGEFYDMDGIQYICYSHYGWREASVLDMKGRDYFNSEINYGTLEDTRDGRTYKTVDIGGKTWMAENLDYKGSGIGKCYNDDEENCEITGRFYEWDEFMNAADSGDALTNQGICPDGWQVPADSDYTALLAAAPGVALYAFGAWGYTNDTYTYATDVNSSGFTALGANMGNDGSFVSGSAGFCIATPANSARYQLNVQRYFGTGNKPYIYSRSESIYCSLRCVKNPVAAEEPAADESAEEPGEEGEE